MCDRPRDVDFQLLRELLCPQMGLKCHLDDVLTEFWRIPGSKVGSRRPTIPIYSDIPNYSDICIRHICIVAG